MVAVEQLNVHRCFECGQVLPESYEPPADEDWATGIFGCCDEKESCESSNYLPTYLMFDYENGKIYA